MHNLRVRHKTSPSGKGPRRYGPLLKAHPTTGHQRYPAKFLKEYNHGSVSDAQLLARSRSKRF